MTTQEMIDAFLLDYDLNGSGAVAGFEDSEIVSFLNKEQLQLVERIYLEYGPNQLYSIIKEGNLQIAGVDSEDSNEHIGTLPSDYMFHVSSKVIVTRSFKPIITTKGWVECDLINDDSTDKFYNSGMNSPIIINPLIFIIGDKFKIIKDSDTTIESDTNTGLYSVKMKYIKVPLEMDLISQNSELSEKWHQDIVNGAVVNALKVTNDLRIRQSVKEKSDK